MKVRTFRLYIAVFAFAVPVMILVAVFCLKPPRHSVVNMRGHMPTPAAVIAQEEVEEFINPRFRFKNEPQEIATKSDSTTRARDNFTFRAGAYPAVMNIPERHVGVYEISIDPREGLTF
jgi:hypothetical protein